MPVKKYKVEIVDEPEIGKVVGIVVKEVRKKNEDAAKRKRVIVDMDTAKLTPPAVAGAPAMWLLKLRRPANDPGTAGDRRVVANTVHLIIYDRYEKIVDRITRRFRAPPTP